MFIKILTEASPKEVQECLFIIFLIPGNSWGTPGHGHFWNPTRLVALLWGTCLFAANSYLVGGLEHGWILSFHILGIIIPTDEHIFQRGGSTTNQWLSWFSKPKQANGLKLRDFKEVDGHMMSFSKSQPWRLMFDFCSWLDIHDIEESSLPGVRRCLVFTVNEGLEINSIYQAFGQITGLTGNIYEHDYHFLTRNQCI
jgi:hypothetical protein